MSLSQFMGTVIYQVLGDCAANDTICELHDLFDAYVWVSLCISVNRPYVMGRAKEGLRARGGGVSFEPSEGRWGGWERGSPDKPFQRGCLKALLMTHHLRRKAARKNCFKKNFPMIHTSKWSAHHVHHFEPYVLGYLRPPPPRLPRRPVMGPVSPVPHA